MGNRLAAVTLLHTIVTLTTVSALAGAAETNLVFGKVSDLTGKPIGGAHVIARRSRAEPLGDTTTDAAGRFRIRCPSAASDVTLIVERAAGFQRSTMVGVKTGGRAIEIVLSRIIDTAYLMELARESDPVRFRARAADLLTPAPGYSASSLPIPQIVPAIAALRAPLRAWLPADPAAVARAQLPPDQDRALLLLALAGDPRDDEMVKAWIAGDGHRGARPYRPCRGATIDEAVRAWEDLVFTNAGYSEGQPRPLTARMVQEAPDGNHAVVSDTIQRREAAYSQELVLGRERGTWEVRWVVAGSVVPLRAGHE